MINSMFFYYLHYRYIENDLKLQTNMIIALAFVPPMMIDVLYMWISWQTFCRPNCNPFCCGLKPIISEDQTRSVNYTVLLTVNNVTIYLI